jgi:hypothetical protein
VISLKSLALKGAIPLMQIGQNSTPSREQIKHLGVKTNCFKIDISQSEI